MRLDKKTKLTFHLNNNMADSEYDRKIIATHEAGHALLSYLFYPNEEVQVNIDSNNEEDGITYCSASEGFATEEECRNNIKVSLGGIIANDLLYGEQDVGGGADFEDVNAVIEKMFESGIFGLDYTESAFGHSEKWLQGKEKKKKDYLIQVYQEAKEDLEKNKGLLKKMTEKILRDGTLDREDIDALKEQFEARKK